MPTARINGTTAPVQQDTEFTFDPQRGLYVVEPWECAGDNLRGVAAQYQAMGVPFQLTASSVKSKLVATASGNGLGGGGFGEVITDTWQILANEMQKDLREHIAFKDVSDTVIVQINKGVQDGTAPGDMSPALTGAASTLYGLLHRGTTHYAISQYVLHHTTNVGSGYSANIADVNIEKVYTTAQLIAECTNGNLWYQPLPPRMVYKLQNIAAPAARTGYLWGWRKLASTETTQAGGRIGITTEYWLEQWNTTLYPAAT